MDVVARLKDLAVSDTGFVFDPYSGLTFSVNRAGKLILDRLKAGASPEEIERSLADSFDTDSSDDLGRDVREFIIQLRQAGLLPRQG